MVNKTQNYSAIYSSSMALQRRRVNADPVPNIVSTWLVRITHHLGSDRTYHGLQYISPLPQIIYNHYTAAVLAERQHVYCKVSRDRNKWKAMLPTCLIAKIFRFVHHTLGHLGVDKCLEEIRYVLQVRDLGKKLRRLIASYDVYQRVKHPQQVFYY